jgi:hypothetical protein
MMKTIAICSLMGSEPSYSQALANVSGGGRFTEDGFGEGIDIDAAGLLVKETSK